MHPRTMRRFRSRDPLQQIRATDFDYYVAEKGYPDRISKRKVLAPNRTESLGDVANHHHHWNWYYATKFTIMIACRLHPVLVTWYGTDATGNAFSYVDYPEFVYVANRLPRDHCVLFLLAPRRGGSMCGSPQ